MLRGASAVEVVRALTNDESVVAVGRPEMERKLRHGSRRPIDVAAEIKLDGGGGFWLGVEVKTDSAWTKAQLSETLGDSDQGILLVVGYTALAVSEHDLAAIDSRRPWRRVGPRDLAAIVRAHAATDAELLSYADHLAREADEHARAQAAVRDNAQVDWGRRPKVLEHWAYFGEILRHRADAPEWERKALVSGPLMTRWLVDRGDGSGDYLEFMGQGTDRTLCVKTWASTGRAALMRNRDRLLHVIDEPGARTTKLPSDTAKTCTAAKLSLDGVRPDEAARLVDQLAMRVERASSS